MMTKLSNLNASNAKQVTETTPVKLNNEAVALENETKRQTQTPVMFYRQPLKLSNIRNIQPFLKTRRLPLNVFTKASAFAIADSAITRNKLDDSTKQTNIESEKKRGISAPQYEIIRKLTDQIGGLETKQSLVNNGKLESVL